LEEEGVTEPNLREITLDVLYEVLEQDGYIHLVLGATLEKYQYLTKQQRAFITRLTQGTTERLLTIDGVLDQFVKKPKVAKMKPQIRTILRQGVYQILYMDSIPDAAVCNEAVKLAKKRGFGTLSGFVNGVLRNISRQKETISFTGWSMCYAMPQWIIDEWLRDYDRSQVEEMLIASLAEKKTCIRVNTARISPEELQQCLRQQGMTVEPVQGIPYGFYLSGYDYLKGIPEFARGLFYVQDFSSMMVAHVADLQSGDYVIDVCGAPGGKSLHAAELLQGSGMVEARDISDHKVFLMQENIKKSGLQNIRARKMDATVLDEASVDQADVVLCDAPCSGLGVIAGKPDIKYHMTKEKQQDLAALQQQILSVVCRYVKPGGTLLYSTCTVSRVENEDNVSRFLAEHPEFSLDKEEQILPAAGTRDGFFYARMKRVLS
jgi:16S rRNA (cytosine967-C5)-methyltransferase